MAAIRMPQPKALGTVKFPPYLQVVVEAVLGVEAFQTRQVATVQPAR